MTDVKNRWTFQQHKTTGNSLVDTDKKWSLTAYGVTNKTIAAGGSFILFDEAVKGYFLGASMISNNKDVQIDLRLDTETIFESSGTFLGLATYGYVSPPGFYLSRYDDVNDVYAAGYDPKTPGGTPFNGRAKIKISNLSLTTAVVTVTASIIVLED